jgi:hypothetical protein
MIKSPAHASYLAGVAPRRTGCPDAIELKAEKRIPTKAEKAIFVIALASLSPDDASDTQHLTFAGICGYLDLHFCSSLRPPLRIQREGLAQIDHLLANLGKHGRIGTMQ